MTRDNFFWDGSFWVSEVIIPEWGSDQSVQVALLNESALVAPPEPNMDFVQAFMRHKTGQASAALAALLKAYPEIYDSYVDAIDPDFVEQDLPKVESEAELLKLVTLTSVNIHPVVAAGLPYVGYGADCTWDPEHGAGILMHGNRCVEVGGVDAAILQWIAERDARSFR